jgi:signal transduction histidine kinase
LPLVRELAAANGAEISIESAEGKGTSVTLLFPKNRVIPV